jgi:hypothetical protein
MKSRREPARRATQAKTAAKPYAYIYINADGTARELHASEREYLEKEFTLGDGAMPYIKDSYDERDGWGELSGYLKREALPAGTAIEDARLQNPRRPLTREDFAAWLRSKGVEVIEHDDGSMTISKPRPDTR